jgi:hypothetical protein
MTNDPVASYSLCLLFSTPPIWTADALQSALKNRSGGELHSGDTFEIIHHEHFQEQPPRAILSPAEPIDAALIEKALRQTWDWPLAESVLKNCTQSVSVRDRFSQRLPYKVRLGLIQQTAAALLEVASHDAPCLAIHAPLCQRLIEPAAFLQGQSPGGDHLCGAVNVRLYKVEDQGAGCRLMDTLGLAALGLPDLQCVFRGIDPNDLAAVLWDYAYYLYEKGDVIADGDVVKGLRAGQHWTCGRQQSLTEPERIVLDIYPGLEFGPPEGDDGAVRGGPSLAEDR